MSEFGDLSSSDLPKGGDHELQEFLMVEKQKAQFNAQVSFTTRLIFFALIYLFHCRFTNLTTFVGKSVWTNPEVN